MLTADDLEPLKNELAEIRARLEALEAKLTALTGASRAEGGRQPNRPDEPPASALPPNGEPPDSLRLESESDSAPSPLVLGASGAEASAEPADDPLTLGENEPAATSAASNETARLIGRLAEIRAAIDAGKGSVAARDAAFLDKASQVLEQKGPDGVAGGLGEKIVSDCVQTQFPRLAKYSFPSYDAFRAVVDAVEKEFIVHLEKKAGLNFFPYPGESLDAVAVRLPQAASQIERRPVSSLRPKGALVSVVRRGVLAANGSVQKAIVTLSAGADGDAPKLILAAGNALARASRGGEAAAGIHKALSNLAEGGRENAVLRETVNACWAANADKALDGAIQKMLDRLQSAFGWHRIRVAVGEPFGDKHSPSKFERKKVSSDRKAGTIVSVLRPGFIDKDGVPVQKAILGVSG